MLNKKIPQILIPVAIALALLFYLGQISFQMEHFNWFHFLTMLLQVSLPIAITVAIENYRLRKRKEKNKH